jgi:hypothetical protein
MALDLRTQLNGFSIETLRGHLAKIENDPTYSYYADVIRAFLSSDAKEVAKYQQDERPQVAIAACCNPLADLEFLNSNFKKFALVAALNPSINDKITTKIQKYEHCAIPVFIASNQKVEVELKVFSLLAYGHTEVTGDDIDDWYAESIDSYEESPSQALYEIAQLLCLETLGFFSEGGGSPFWQMLESADFEPEDKFWTVLGKLPRVPSIIYDGGAAAVNNHIARELAAEKALPKDLVTELAQDDLRLAFDSDSWFISRSPRASVAFSIHAPSALLSQMIAEEVLIIESTEEYVDGSLAVLWRVAGNESLKTSHIDQIHDFVSKNLNRFSDEMFDYDVLSLLQGGNYVDAPLLSNSAFPTEFKDKFEALIKQIEGRKK